MIYTIGSKSNYLEAIAQKGAIFKKGKDIDYVGGYAFHTIEDAKKRIREAYPDMDFIVWGILADWDKDAYKNPDGGWWRNLLIDALIVPV